MFITQAFVAGVIEMGCYVLEKRVGLLGQKLGFIRCWSSAGVHRLSKEDAETQQNMGRSELGPGFLPRHVIMVIKHQKDPLKALEVFSSVARDEGFKHTFSTYKALIEKLGYHGEFESMEKVLTEMRMNISGGSLEGVYIGVMRNYGRLGKVQEAVNTFERMEFYDCEPTVGSYNTIMNILVENNYFKQAHKVYLRMRDKGIDFDVYTFTIRIKSFCRTKRAEAALRLLHNMPKQGCKANAVAYCNVIGSLYEENRASEASCLFDKMLGEDIVPDVATFNKLIHTLCKKGGLKERNRLLDKVLIKGVQPNVFTYNNLIRGLCKEGDASKLLEEMLLKGLVPDVVTYNTLIS